MKTYDALSENGFFYTVYIAPKRQVKTSPYKIIFKHEGVTDESFNTCADIVRAKIFNWIDQQGVESKVEAMIRLYEETGMMAHIQERRRLNRIDFDSLKDFYLNENWKLTDSRTTTGLYKYFQPIWE